MVAKIRAPGFYRAAVWMVLAVGFATALTWLVRSSTGHSTYTHYLNEDAILTVALLVVPLAFLAGIGGMDYWFYWATGRPTRPEDHSGHGAYSWKDYFRINTDHKVIGVQYLGQLVLLPARRRADRHAHARPARPAGISFRRRQHLQRPVFRPRHAAHLPVHGPRVRGLRQLRDTR